MKINIQDMDEQELCCVAYSMSWVGADYTQDFDDELLVPIHRRVTYREQLAKIYSKFKKLKMETAVLEWFRLHQSLGEDPDRIICWLLSMLEEDGKARKLENWENLLGMSSEDEFFNDLSVERDQVNWIFDSYRMSVFTKFENFDQRLQILEFNLKTCSELSATDRQIQGWPEGCWSKYGIQNFYWKYLVRLQRDWFISIQNKLTASDLAIIDSFYTRRFETSGSSKSDVNAYMSLENAFSRYRGLDFWQYCSSAS